MTIRRAGKPYLVWIVGLTSRMAQYSRTVYLEVQGWLVICRLTSALIVFRTTVTLLTTPPPGMGPKYSNMGYVGISVLGVVIMDLWGTALMRVVSV